jgi:tRNA A37 threonylcarbamoyladenosine synthetase subunit TsaC/SUA5/YrdC
MDSYARYFPKGYGCAPSVESVLEPRANEAIIFDDFFTFGLRMPSHLVLVDILRKFRV